MPPLTTMPLNDNNTYDVVIVGGGITGMATAIGLIRRGITNILLLEKATTLHPVGASIAIFSNGFKALHYLSPTVSEKVKKSCIPIDNMVVKDLQGNVIREKKPPSDAQVSYLVWYLLQQYLAAELPDGILQLGYTLETISEQNDIVTIKASNRSSGEVEMIQTRVLIGADGIHSLIRQFLFGSNAVTKLYHGKVMYRSVLPMSAIQDAPPAGINITYQGDEPGKLFSYRETSQDILTVTAMARFDNEPSFDTYSLEEKKQHLLQVFSEYPSQVQAVLQHVSPESIHMQPIQDINVLEPCWSKGPVIVIGDAAHAMSPAMGQGANQGLEDAAVLVHVLSSTSGGLNNIESSLNKVYSNRIDRVKLIHAASRARSMENNKSSKSKPIDMTSQELKRVLDEIASWNAPVDDGERMK